MIYPDEDRPAGYIGRRQRRTGGVLFVVIAVIVLLFASRYIASTLIDYAWWSEVHQVDTWISLLLYGTGPLVLIFLLFFACFWTAFRIGIRHDQDTVLFGVFKRSVISKIAAAGAAVLAFIDRKSVV